jgi:hypothetical protein
VTEVVVVTVQYRRLNEERLMIIEEIQNLDGFHDFLSPKALHNLQVAADNGPVVILNASISRCDALAVTSSGVKHVALSKITPESLHSLVTVLQYASSSDASLPETIFQDVIQQVQNPVNKDVFQKLGRVEVKDNKVEPNVIFSSVLEVLWTKVVQPVISLLNLEVHPAHGLSFSYLILNDVVEIRIAKTLMVVPYWPIFLPSHPCGWYL